MTDQATAEREQELERIERELVDLDAIAATVKRHGGVAHFATETMFVPMHQGAHGQIVAGRQIPPSAVENVPESKRRQVTTADVVRARADLRERKERARGRRPARAARGRPAAAAPPPAAWGSL